MSVQVPEEIQWLLELVCGETWPDGDEDALRALAQVWTDAAHQLQEAQQTATGYAHQVGDVYTGAAATAFESFWSSVMDDGRTSWSAGESPAALPWAVQFCTAMADSCTAGANEIETTKLTIIGNITILLATLAPQLLIPFEGEAALAVEVPIEREATEVVISQAVKKIVARVVVDAIKMGLLQGGLNLEIQLIEVGQGHASSVDWRQVKQSSETGALGGGLGAGFGGMTSLAGRAIGGGTGDFLGSAAGKFTTAMSGGVITNVGSDLVMNHRVQLSDMTGGLGASVVGATAESMHGEVSPAGLPRDVTDNLPADVSAHLSVDLPAGPTVDVSDDGSVPDAPDPAGLRDRLASMTTLLNPDGSVKPAGACT